MRIAGKAAIAITALGLTVSAEAAEEVSFCVTCSAPQQAYTCTVEIPHGSPGSQALQLYCMAKTAKDGNHRSCAVSRKPTGQCLGAVKRYSYDYGGSLPGVRSAVRHLRDKPPTPPPAPASEAEKPSTLFGLTSRAVKASGRGVKKTGETVVKATKNTGSAIGGAARSAYDCVKKLFRRCGKDEDTPESVETAAESQPVPITPESARPE